MLRTSYSRKSSKNCTRTATGQSAILFLSASHCSLFIICSVWISAFYLIYMIHSKENSIQHSRDHFFRLFVFVISFAFFPLCSGSVWMWVWFFFSPSRFLLCHFCSSYCLYSLRWLLTVTLWRYDCVYKPKLFMRAVFSLLFGSVGFFFGFSAWNWRRKISSFVFCKRPRQFHRTK